MFRVKLTSWSCIEEVKCNLKLGSPLKKMKRWTEVAFCILMQVQFAFWCDRVGFLRRSWLWRPYMCRRWLSGPRRENISSNCKPVFLSKSFGNQLRFVSQLQAITSSLYTCKPIFYYLLGRTFSLSLASHLRPLLINEIRRKMKGTKYQSIKIWLS